MTAVDARPSRPLALAAQLALVPRYFRGALPHPGRVLALADLGPELGTLRSRAHDGAGCGTPGRLTR